jgi:ADP-ribosyl-[dinitrogen reductase] hydrolase
MGRRFVAWYREGLWTPHGRVFDIGLATSRALGRIGSGVTAELAGGDSENDNGNGSLMRIIPVALWFADEPTKSLLDRVHRASAITHRHLRSQMACGFHALIIRQLLDGSDPPQALAQAVAEFRSFYEQNQSWAAQLKHFQLLLAGDLARKPESGIQSSGYVIHTLTASLWCLLTTATYEACVLAAVNLGGDTDTTGCVAGGLAGVYYGLPRIQERWRRSLARFDEVNSLFNHFAEDAAS